jgi:heme exporter protein B
MAGRQFRAMLQKDLVRELRTKETLISMFLFVVLAMVIFHYAFAARSVDLTSFTGGMLWAVFIFAALLGLNRTFAQEKDEECLDGLLLCPVDRVTIFLAKMTANLIFLLVIEVISVPIFALFFVRHGFLHVLPTFALVVLLADLGLCALGTLLATISVHTRARDLLLPIIFLPLAVPVLIAASAGTSAIFAQRAGFAALGAKLGFLAAVDAVFLVLAYGTFDFALGE